MKISPIFGLVLTIHLVVIILLALQPGCQTTQREAAVRPQDTLPPERATPPPAARHEDGAVTVVRPAAARSEPATIDEAFNAGFKPLASAGPRTAERQGGRAEPMRPQPGTGVLSDSDPAERLPVVGDRPRFDVYTVQRGDSLWKIANDHGINLEHLLEANQLTKQSVIHAGQTLRIPLIGPEMAPAPPREQRLEGLSADVSVTTYTVQPGDNLSRIAARYGTTVAAIKSANRKQTDAIYAGENLTIPVPEGAAPPRAAPPPPAVRPAPEPSVGTAPGGRPLKPGQYLHTVQPGENPTTIANRYGMRAADLVRLNGNFDPRLLKEGQVLIVEPAPGKAPPTGERQVTTDRSPPPRQEQTTPQPIRIRVVPEEARTEEVETEDVDLSTLLDDVEEIPVVPVRPADGNP